MRKLTQKQKEELNLVSESLIEMNAPLLFDIQGAIKKGTELRSELDALNKENQEKKEKQRLTCLTDFNRLQEFLGEYKDLVVMNEDESEFYYSIVVGIDKQKKIFITYKYGVDYFMDDEYLHVLINEEYHQKYVVQGLEVYSMLSEETDWFDTLDDMFSSDDYINDFEKLLTQYIVKC